MILASYCCNTYMVMQWWFRQAELASGGTSPLYLQALYVMWSKSFRSDDLQLPAIDLTADTSAATSSSPPDAEPDTEDKMRTRPSKRSRSQITDRNFVHYIRTAVSAQTQATSEKKQLICAEQALSMYAEQSNAGFSLDVQQEWDWNSPKPEIACEALSQACLRGHWVYFAQLRRIFDWAPTQVHTRHVWETLGPQVPRSLMLGACVRGGVNAVHVSTRSLVWTTRLLCTVVRTLCPDLLFSTVFLNLNVPSGVHVDAHNHAMIDNALIPLSIWQGGELWHECLDGDVMLQPDGPKGSIKQIVLPSLRFNSRLKHAVMPWVGDRFLRGTFHVRDEWRLKECDMQFLTAQGFKLCYLDQAVQDPYLEH